METKRMHLSLSKDVMEKLNEISAKSGISRNAIVRQIVNNYVEVYSAVYKALDNPDEVKKMIEALKQNVNNQ